MAARYWVGGGSSTNWSATAPTNWSIVSGGPNNASIPTISDDAIFDSNSGVGVSVADGGYSIGTLDCTGYAGTLSLGLNNYLYIAGNKCKFSAGMTYTAPNSSAEKLRFGF